MSCIHFYEFLWLVHRMGLNDLRKGEANKEESRQQAEDGTGRRRGSGGAVCSPSQADPISSVLGLHIYTVCGVNRWTINLISSSTPSEIDFLLAFNFAIINCIITTVFYWSPYLKLKCRRDFTDPQYTLKGWEKGGRGCTKFTWTEPGENN